MALGKVAAKAASIASSAHNVGQQRLYNTLCRVLDSLRAEAPTTTKVYHPNAGNADAIVQARSRALLHLYLKARFGLTNFADREMYVTDGSHDGGIDAYYIDKKTKIIHILQAKFRANAGNFAGTDMTPSDLLKMDVARIVKKGLHKDEQGNSYNDRILKGLLRALQKLPDPANYDTNIVLLGNSRKFTTSELKKLIEGYEVEQFDHGRVYAELLFPVVNGTYFSEPNLTIDINLANVNSHTHLDYDVRAEGQKTNIKLLFVPTREIGRIMDIYKNSVLRYNPRSFLELSANSVNQDIEASIRNATSNEFALFNNGVTIISDGTKITSNTARRDTAQVIVTNPQLVNGGQTAYTLGRIYKQCETQNNFDVFKGKEVLLRVITFVGKQTQANSTARLKLLGDISKASNSQTRVDESDRRSNDPIQVKLQTHFFEKYGLYYERKKGEFSDGLHSGYITAESIVDRDKLLRVSLASDYRVNQARSSISKFYQPQQLTDLLHLKDVGKYAYGYEVLRLVEKFRKGKPDTPGDRYNTKKYGQGLRYGQYALVAVCVNSAQNKGISEKVALLSLLAQWQTFETWAAKQATNKSYKIGSSFDYANYYKGSTVNQDLQSYAFQF